MSAYGQSTRPTTGAAPTRESDYHRTIAPDEPVPPGEPGRDYRPVFSPDVGTLPFKVVDGVKVFHLVAHEFDHEFAPGLRCRVWGYNGKTPGPTIEAVEGDRVRVYGVMSEKTGVNAIKVGLRGTRRAPFKYNEGQKFVDEVVERFKALREKVGNGVDIGVEFHGAVQPPTAMRLIHALEPFNPWFYEEIAQALNVDVMAEMAAKTHIPIATGERIFTKWGFREILEKRAAG